MNPPTDCDLCLWEEATRRERARLRFTRAADRFYRWGLSPGSDMISQLGRQWSSSMHALIGIKPADPWYERHRSDYVRTGEILELERSLRHVSRGDGR